MGKIPSEMVLYLEFSVIDADSEAPSARAAPASVGAVELPKLNPAGDKTTQESR